jgi:hypothetical protein
MSCRCRAVQRVGFFRRQADEVFSRAAGRLAPKPSGGRRHAKLDPHRTFLLGRIAEKADMTMPEFSAELATATGIKADPASLSRWLRSARRTRRHQMNAALRFLATVTESSNSDFYR